jgi:predicted dehydrogenase
MHSNSNELKPNLELLFTQHAMNKIKLGMIGGGTGSFIGAVHRKAAALDGYYELVCGALNSQPDLSLTSGLALGLKPDRCYDSWPQMLQSEAKRDPADRMQAVVIVTPNHLHAEPAIMALEHGFHVVLDKPIALTLTQAQQIAAALKASGCKLALTHTYAGYPMIRQARDLIASGKFGQLRKVLLEYPQGWLSTALENNNQKQASWRTNPAKSGAGAIGDIGTHAAHLAEYVSGLKITQVCAELRSFVTGRDVDDDAAALLHFENNVSGVLIASQVAAGEENNVRIRVYGELGGLEWCHQDHNSLLVKMLDQPVQIYRSGSAYLSPAAALNTRLPAGHPEGFIEAFANIYSAFARDLNGVAERYDEYPSILEGLRGMAFIAAMQKSSACNQAWTPVEV